MSTSQFFETTELLEAALLDENISPGELLRLHGTSQRVYQTIVGSPKLQRKLFLSQEPLPPGILPGRFRALIAKQNKIITRDVMTRAFRIRSQPGLGYLMYWVLRHDYLATALPRSEQTFLCLTMYMTDDESAKKTSERWGDGKEYLPEGGNGKEFLPESCLDMYLTDIPIAAVVHMQQVTDKGNMSTDVWFPAGTKMRDILKWQDMWSKGEIQDGDRVTGYPPLEGVFCSRTLLDMADREVWSPSKVVEADDET